MQGNCRSSFLINISACFEGARNMRKGIFLTSVLLVMASAIVSGCTVRHYHYAQERSASSTPSSQQSSLATKYFRAGRDHYLGCRFRKSITHLEKAIVFESSNSRKALCCVYIGAAWFYLEEVPSAKNSFSRAKQYSWEVRPSKTEFPFEIMKLYEESP